MTKPDMGWKLGTLYNVTLDEWVSDAVLMGFSNKTHSLKRYFNNEAEIDAYRGELWLNGLSNVTIKEIDRDQER